MKFTSYAFAGALAPLVSAFPAAMMDAVLNDPEFVKRASEITRLIESRQAGAGAATPLFEPFPTFDSKAQYIDVSPGSGHEWEAPGPGDLRGPCPGLNALANHKFLPHDGYASIEQFISACNSVVGMGKDLAGFLALYGAAIDGSGFGWSVGGPPTLAESGGIPGGNGLIGSHNKYEADGSPTRPDLYEAGNNYITQASQFQELINNSPESVTMDTLTEFRSQRFDTQISRNPYFFNGPFTGVLVQPAAYTFIFRFMANHSEEYKDGYLDHDVVKSWFGITGESGSYVAHQGHERIPDNWWRRQIEYPYSIPFFLADAVAAAGLHPKFLDVGGNTGKVNTFTGINLDDFTSGVFNGDTLLKGNNLGCFAYQISSQTKPDLVVNALNKLQSTVGSLVSQLSCPQLRAIKTSMLEQFPGYDRSPFY